MDKYPALFRKNLPAGLESPIEEIFYGALRFAASIDGYQFDVVNSWEGVPHEFGDYIVVQPQTEIGKYRVDFLIEYQFVNRLKVIVECDGHDYHERTKEQASYDKARDRYLQKLGYKVFRWSGSDINADAYGCAYELFDFILDWQADQIDAGHEAVVEAA